MVFKKGHVGCFKGKKFTDEHRKRISESNIGKHKVSETHRQKLRLIHLGTHLSEEARRKMSLIRKGRPQSEEAKRKNSEAHKMERNPAWRNGISFEPYSIEWTRELKRFIRDRDNHKCQYCQKNENELEEKLHIHHIDYDKQNCKEENLISLCCSCHIATNNNRDYWFAYYTYLMEKVNKNEYKYSTEIMSF
jgi:5-methylcytosine-specific restriction endonuclease McrA